MKSLISAMLLALSATAFSASAETDNSLLTQFPPQADPQSVATRVINHFIVTPHTRFGNPRAEKPAHIVTYPDVCTWLGSLWFAKTIGDTDMTDRLINRFEPLFTTQSKLLPSKTNVDANVFGSVPLEIYIQRGGDRYLNLGKPYADSQWVLPENHKPQQKEHADKGYSWQTRLWIDDMFMITTVQSQAYRATGDRNYIDRAAREMVLYLNTIQRPNGLFYHAPHAPHFWCRGNGWMAAGMAELLQQLPADNPNRPEIMKAYIKMMDTLKSYQNESGLWRQIIDDTEAWDETSGSAMFTYAMVVGIKQGWLDYDSYAPVVRKGWIGLVSKLSSDNELLDVCEGTNAKDDRQFYLHRKHITGDLHAHAPFIWAATELVTLKDSKK